MSERTSRSRISFLRTVSPEKTLAKAAATNHRLRQMNPASHMFPYATILQRREARAEERRRQRNRMGPKVSLGNLSCFSHTVHTAGISLIQRAKQIDAFRCRKKKCDDASPSQEFPMASPWYTRAMRLCNSALVGQVKAYARISRHTSTVMNTESVAWCDTFDFNSEA